MNVEPADVLNFWFIELSEKDWFSKNSLVDNAIRERFGLALYSAERGELFKWRMSPQGRLAEIIVLDQFSRHIFRGTPNAFRNDIVALTLAQEMVLLEDDLKLNSLERTFAYMPFMHSESPVVHETALDLFESLGDENALKYEILHKNIIDIFGRYPHRNKILGRYTTNREQEFLSRNPGF